MKKLRPMISLALALIGTPILSLSSAETPKQAQGSVHPAHKTATKGPNVIFILADDLGTGNLGCYGADNFKTPQIDALAQSGTRFKRCYTSPLCGPSRALLLTGRYAFRTGMTSNDSGPLVKPENETLIPKLLKSAGYATAMAGKWSQLTLQPSDWGFDEYLRFKSSGQYWNYQPKAKTFTLNGNDVPLLDKEYLPDKMQEFVVSFINKHKDEQFFVYYPLSHVHEDILPTPDSIPGSTTLYRDNVEYMDKLVGKLVAEIDRLKLRDNTLIIFAGDNGTTHTQHVQSTIGGRQLSGWKGTMLEGGALVPCIASWPGQIPAGVVSTNLIDFSDMLPTIAEIAGAKIPEGLTIDGKSFAAPLRGAGDLWPRSWIFVELGRHWFGRSAGWKLDEIGQLFEMKDAPFAEPLVPAEAKDEAATAARQELQRVLGELNPAGGIVDTGDGSGSHSKAGKDPAKKKEKKARRKAIAEGKDPTSIDGDAAGPGENSASRPLKGNSGSEKSDMNAETQATPTDSQNANEPGE